MYLFWEKGFEGTHLADLVQVTGVNRFALYSEFEGKEGLFRAALDLYLEDARRQYHEILNAKPYGADNIRKYFAELTFDDTYHGCFMVNTLTEKHVVSEVAFEAAKALSVESEQLFVKNLQAAKKSGDLGRHDDPIALAGLLASIDLGLSIRGIIHTDDSSHKKIVRLVSELLD